MKTIYVLRHSKAGQGHKRILGDHERPLTKKGADLCKVIGGYLIKQSPSPQHILSSTAKRAQKTAELVLKEIKVDVPIVYDSRLYLATADDLFREIKNLNNNIHALLLVGHNPGLQEFCLLLADDRKHERYKDMKNLFPPGSLVTFTMNTKNWNEVTKKSGKIKDFFIPKDRKAG